MSALANRFGCRLVTQIGSVIASLGFLLSYWATSVLWLDITFGVIGGQWRVHWSGAAAAAATVVEADGGGSRDARRVTDCLSQGRLMLLPPPLLQHPPPPLCLCCREGDMKHSFDRPSLLLLLSFASRASLTVSLSSFLPPSFFLCPSFSFSSSLFPAFCLLIISRDWIWVHLSTSNRNRWLLLRIQTSVRDRHRRLWIRCVCLRPCALLQSRVAFPRASI